MSNVCMRNNDQDPQKEREDKDLKSFYIMMHDFVTDSA